MGREVKSAFWLAVITKMMVHWIEDTLRKRWATHNAVMLTSDDELKRALTRVSRELGITMATSTTNLEVHWGAGRMLRARPAARKRMETARRRRSKIRGASELQRGR